ncbi:MAG: helix-turn-helix transcriptional regulator [Paludibacter sp.]|jgi:transcriptional regulator with XRE-family HTH domain|nr:helix-turn-helix transcriptional regulator [Paludibacter sp.]
MEDKDKIDKVMQEFNLNSAQFAAEIGIQGSTLSHILNGRNRPSLDVLKKIMSRFTSINPEWLILDKEPMFRQEKNSQAPTLFDSFDENAKESDVYEPKAHQKTPSPSVVIQKENVNIINGATNNNISKLDEPQLSNNSIPVVSKSPVKIIVYYDDNTFQEFHP